jgi:hypothetical protein
MSENAYELVEALERFGVAEVPGGWRVVERHSRGVKIHKTVHGTLFDAQARAEALESAWRRSQAGQLARRRARGRCECVGECGRHTASCGNLEGAPVAGLAPARVSLTLIAVNHDRDDLREDNMRLHCQLCRQHHDDQEYGAPGLFTLDDMAAQRKSAGHREREITDE